jgi:hypothetical protein
MLGKILSSMAGTAPSFADFTSGGPAQRSFPGGFGPGIASLLQAMSQPGAFTSTASQRGQGATPSGISDVSQLAMLAYFISKATGYNLSDILGGVGGAKGIGGINTALGDTQPSPDFLSSLPYGDIPGVNFTPDPYSDPNGMTMDPTQGTTEGDWSWLNSY